MKYRDRTEIVKLILRSSNTTEGSCKTRIMYEAYLSFTQLEDYLVLLRRNGLLEYNETSATFKATEKGVRLLELCNKLHEIVDIRITKKDLKNSAIVSQ
jgi:predicted transcriptional regulator